MPAPTCFNRWIRNIETYEVNNGVFGRFVHQIHIRCTNIVKINSFVSFLHRIEGKVGFSHIATLK
jgi:hypothetical protein